jgi:biotin carboxyl carrier protein
MKYEIVSGSREARLSVEGSRVSYQTRDGQTIEREFSVTPAGPGRYSILVEGRSYAVTVLPDGNFSVNGVVIPIEVIDPREYRGRGKAGLTEGHQQVAALMPGRVVNVLVEAGATVEAGQGLIVVEAMKMQNEMKSPKTGRVAEVKTRPGAAVAAGEVLMVIE